MPKKSGTFLRIFELREGIRRGIPAGHYRRRERGCQTREMRELEIAETILWLDGGRS